MLVQFGFALRISTGREFHKRHALGNSERVSIYQSKYTVVLLIIIKCYRISATQNPKNT